MIKKSRNEPRKFQSDPGRKGRALQEIFLSRLACAALCVGNQRRLVLQGGLHQARVSWTGDDQEAGDREWVRGPGVAGGDHSLDVCLHYEQVKMVLGSDSSSRSQDSCLCP